jgi:hypothetical protein
MKHRSLIFCIIAVLALGLMGYGYAYWSSSVAINATVTTGTFALGIVPVSTTEAVPPDTTGTNDYVWSGGANGAAGVSSLGYSVGEIVGTPGATLSGYTGWDSGVTETYTNVYPDYVAGYTVNIKNLGSVPAALDTPNISWATPGDSVANDYTVYGWTLTDTTHSASNPLASGTDTAMAGLKGVILPAGDLATLTVNAYFKDSGTANGASDLVQNATNTETVKITGVQFNAPTT